MSTSPNNLFLASIRLTAFLFFLILIPRAWAGILFYQGQTALKADDFPNAVRKFQSAQSINSRNPYFDYWKGIAYFKWADKTGEKHRYGKAAASFDLFTQRLPDHGKAWAYLALSSLEIPERSGLVQAYFDKAQTNDPGNAWITAMAGRSLLLQKKLTGSEKAKAAAMIRTALERHYIGKVSPLLGYILRDLWEHFFDMQLLKEITPEDRPSYKKLLDFIDDKGLWSEREPFFMKYWSLKRQEYNDLCRKGGLFLKRRQYRKALSIYESAWALEKKYSEARIGMREAHEALGNIGSEGGQYRAAEPREVFQASHRCPAEYAATQWRGGLLQGRGTAKMDLYLKPGPVVIELDWRGFPQAEERGYVILYLDGEPFGHLYGGLGSSWQKSLFKIETPGGGQRLSAELVNGLPRKGDGRGPVVELGKVRVSV